MLLPWRKHAVVTLSPHRVQVNLDGKVREYSLTKTANRSQILNEVADILRNHQLPLKSARVTVRLSNHFVRYATMNWQSGIVKHKDWQVLAENHFKQIFVSSANTFSVKAQVQAYGKPLLLAATDNIIVEKIEQLAQQQKWQLVAIEPELIHVGKLLPRKRANNSYILFCETERVLLAEIDSGIWQGFTVTTPVAGEEQSEALRLLHRAKQYQEDDKPLSIYTYGNIRLESDDLAFAGSVTELPAKSDFKHDGAVI